MEKTTNQHNSLEKFCYEILSFDESIRFAGIADNLGHLVATQYRKGLLPLMDKEETEKYTIQAIIRAGSREGFKSKIGRQKYAVGVYEKLTRATVPFTMNNNNSSNDRKFYLLLSFDIGSDFAGIINGKVLPKIERKAVTA